MKDLRSFTLSVLQELKEEGRFGTAHVYRSTLKAFTAYWQQQHPGKNIPMRMAFTPAALAGFERHLEERMRKMNTLSTYMRMLRAIYHRALNRGVLPYVPGLFDHVYTGTRADVKRALPTPEMGQLLDTDSPCDHRLEEVRIWFALLFLLRGMPFADLARLRKCDLQDGVITYRRQKTGRPLSIRLTAQTAELIQRCADRHPDSPYLIDILWNVRRPGQDSIGSQEEYHRYQTVLRSFNRRLKELARLLGIDARLTTYTARHTWATIAYHRKFATGIISNALGHSSVKVTETYLKPFENEVIDKANLSIIDYTERYGRRK